MSRGRVTQAQYLRIPLLLLLLISATASIAVIAAAATRRGRVVGEQLVQATTTLQRVLVEFFFDLLAR